jgi:hypothetical protein
MRACYAANMQLSSMRYVAAVFMRCAVAAMLYGLFNVQCAVALYWLISLGCV